MNMEVQHMSDENAKPMPMTRLQVGDVEVTSFIENRCYADGGSMFGVIPKVLWSKHIKCDRDNLIPLDTNLVLITVNHKRLLVDCGIGDLLSEKERKVYSCYTPGNLDACLGRLGLVTDDIDLVIPTHLHLDHIGGAFRGNNRGMTEPRFKSARYVIRQDEWNVAISPDQRSSISYPTDRLKSLAESGQVEFVSEDVEIVDNVWLKRTGGHTAGHQAIEVNCKEGTIICPGDMFPTTAHFKPAWVAAADLYPLQTMDYKYRIWCRASSENIILALDHDLETKFAKLTIRNDTPGFEKVGEPLLAVMESCSENLRNNRKTAG
jgi:glyoxylase-like metal-dependent hydrolase (beta-lactamase superfamily II)